MESMSIQKAKFLIGIDPGASTGVCVYRRSTKKFVLFTCPPWEFSGRLVPALEGIPYGQVHAIMEDPRQNPSVFDFNEKNKLKMLKIAQNVGSVKRDTDWLEQILKEMEISVTLVKPVDSKWSAKLLKNYTGFAEQTNEHTRDAIRMVFGR